MLFSSYEFLLVFLPVVLIIYFGIARFVSRTVQHTFLILASLYFYAYADINFLWIILGSVVVNFACAKLIAPLENSIKRKFIFVFSILANIGLLGYYKYYNFFLDNVNFVFDTHFTLKYIILPIGISFYTFQQIAYQISVWKREETVPRFLDYMLFISYFPQLVAGPIVFYQDVMHQYQDDKNRFFNAENFSKGLFIFCIGIFKKAVLADNMDMIVNNAYDYGVHGLSFGGAWVASLGYTMQIFFDFSGYSDMAIGLGQMMNIKLPVNFYSPYKAKSITEFWQRWHITLGRSLAVLIYFPLGGNRKGYARTCVNLFLVFLVSGIWHGAAWTFIWWGIAHGVVRIFEKIFNTKLEKIPTFIRIFFTFMFVNAAWVLFRIPSIDNALIVLRKMFIPENFSFAGIGQFATDGILTYPDIVQVAYVFTLLAIMMLISFALPKNSIDLYNGFKPKVKYAIGASILLCISIIHLSKAGAFIYFNF